MAVWRHTEADGDKRHIDVEVRSRGVGTVETGTQVIHAEGTTYTAVVPYSRRSSTDLSTASTGVKTEKNIISVIRCAP